MICSKTGFTPLKIAALVVGGIAIVTHITAVAYPEWDGIDADWYPIPGNSIFFKTIKSQGSLWDLTVDDPSRNFFPPTTGRIDTTWKKPIVLMATTGIGAGVLGEGLIVLTALLERCTKRMIIHVCAKMIASGSILCAAFEVLMGAMLYKYNYQRQQSPDLNNTKHLPFDKHVLKAGFYLECAAGGLFILTLLLSFLDIMYYDKRDTSSVSPSENEEIPKKNEKVKKTTESKKDNEKLVVEDLTEKKAEKQK